VVDGVEDAAAGADVGADLHEFLVRIKERGSRSEGEGGRRKKEGGVDWKMEDGGWKMENEGRISGVV
jgi:hypothetical protein